MAKKVPKVAGARAQLCLTPLYMSNRKYLFAVLCKNCSLLLSFLLFLVHLMRKVYCGETAPNWLGSAPLVASGSYPVRAKNISCTVRSNFLCLALHQLSNSLLQVSAAPCVVSSQKIKLE